MGIADIKSNNNTGVHRGSLNSTPNGDLLESLLQIIPLIQQLIELLGYVRTDQGQQMPQPSTYGCADSGSASGTPTGATGGPTIAGLKASGAGAMPSNTPPPDAIDVRAFGAKGDGSTDDQVALQNAFNAAKASGKSVWMGQGIYKHSGVLNIDGISVIGSGSGTVLQATNPDQAAIKLTGNNSSLSNLKAESIGSYRSSMPDAATVLIQNASNASVSNVTTIGATSNGIRLDNATNCTVSGCLVQGSNADGIALMNGSCNNLIQNCVVYQAGDDSFSSDSYVGDRTQNSGNVFRNDLAMDNAYGRGFALMGSNGDTIENSVSIGSKWVGIMTGTDSNSATMAGSNAKIVNNLILDWTGDEPIRATGNGMSVQGNQTSGTAPDPWTILGWTGELLDRNAYNPGYKPGSGPGSNNEAGARS